MTIIPIPSPSSSSTSLVFQSNDLYLSRSSSRLPSTICCSSRNHAYIPKLEPFSRSKIDRVVQQPSFIQKSENDISDYCSILEGDASYNCWRAYFELKDLQRECPKEDIEKLVLESDGVKSLIGCLHGIWAIQKENKNKNKISESESLKPLNLEKQRENKPFPIPDGLPKRQEDLEEEEKGRLPDSPFTRLLRTKGRFPAWYSPAPDHETD